MPFPKKRNGGRRHRILILARLAGFESNELVHWGAEGSNRAFPNIRFGYLDDFL
jgi:hypothetical protein